ncbi:hypothetical protein [Paenibacillus amylolyticus]|uniref:hypothetical protein n=1 Tax=Paenibacillus amylolyticus TaxID=1451 RepID=UPI00201D9D60|nr:hypothetical protein [Paenibacillus amylolyticus]MCL6658468.1 hypothetical protein [Paenibacillus amylolyticus]
MKRNIIPYKSVDIVRDNNGNQHEMNMESKAARIEEYMLAEVKEQGIVRSRKAECDHDDSAGAGLRDTSYINIDGVR